MHFDGIPSKYPIEKLGFINTGTLHWNNCSAQLVEFALERREAALSRDGALIAYTGKHTGRSPKDKYIVRYPDEQDIDWGSINQPIDPDIFEQIYAQLLTFFENCDLFIQDMVTGADSKHSIPIRIITEKAWHSLFARNLFLMMEPGDYATEIPIFTIIHSESIQVNARFNGKNLDTFVLIDFRKKLVLIGGTGYAGEIKKSIFTILNYLLPKEGILSMHCSANVGEESDVALFFGLSGTGKTTLSSDPDRRLIGDDEHGWTENGVFNFEGGCYAKTIHLKQELEPIIWKATHAFGTVLENVAFDPQTRVVDFESNKFTENTRAAYPIEFISNRIEQGYAGHPENIFFLTADAFGVLPPIAMLSPEQAMYYFISGYTSKLGGTETGLGSEPQVTFSACFGAPFLPLPAQTYADLLGERIQKYKVRVWLVNTGWSGGPYGTGSRIKLPYTRAMIYAALNHTFDAIPFHKEPFFGLWIPESCPGVPEEIFEPQKTWRNPEEYAQRARFLSDKFAENYRVASKN